jgi:glycosyltransferase involved in cell wall biosynthesis
MTSTAQISAIVPARNEEATIACAVESLASQPEIAEIIVVNDQSTDRTGEILGELSPRFPQLRVVALTEPLPAGWTGKNRAVARGAEVARGEWLLFTDADVEHLPGSAARTLADAAEHQAALVSYSPEQLTPTWWERAAIPFIFCRLAAHFSYARVNNPERPDAAANGQFLMVRREAYESLGGHAAVAAEVVEDVALAKRVKHAGQRIYFAPGQGIARTRMYRTCGEMWRGWRKNLYALVGGNQRAVWRELCQVVPWIPLVLLAMGGFSIWFPVVAVMLLIGRHMAYAMELRRNRYPRSVILYYMVGAGLYAAMLAASALAYRRGWVNWKGRGYVVGARKEHDLPHAQD